MGMKRLLSVASSYSGEGTEDLLFFSTDETGMMREEGRFRIGGNPSFLCKTGDTLYVGLEKPDEAVILSYHVTGNGRVSMEKTGQISTNASGLCHIWAGENAVFGCCYGSGHVFAVDRGLQRVIWKTRTDREVVTVSHAHCSMETEDGKMLVEADLGMDKVYGFPLSNGKLAGERVTLASFSGMGPRQVLYEKGSEQFIVVGEQGNCMKGYKWLPGQLTYTWKQKWSIPATKRPGKNYPGDACFAENGIIFWGNRGADTIGAARIGEMAQFLGEWECEGKWPRSIFVSKGCVYVACQKSGTVESFVWDGRTLKNVDRLRLEGAACVIAWGFF